MRGWTHKLVFFGVLLSMVLGVQGCGRRSELDWRELMLRSGGSGGGGFDRLKEQLLKSAGPGGKSPEYSILNVHCHPNEFTGRGEAPLFLTSSLLDLIDNYTQDEMDDMFLMIPREITVVENDSQKTKVDLQYMVPMQLYFLALEVVGPDQMESEDVKKIFYTFGIPFLPETYAQLLSMSRVISMDAQEYPKSWYNARRFFEQITQWDLHAQLMGEVLPQKEMVSWLESRGFLTDEIDFLLKLLWLEADPPPSAELSTDYVSIDRCAYALGPMPWFAPAPGGTKQKKPDEVRDHYFDLSLFIPILIVRLYCPSPSPSPSPTPYWVIPGRKVPCPSVEGDTVGGEGDAGGKGGGDALTTASPSPQRPITGSSAPGGGDSTSTGGGGGSTTTDSGGGSTTTDSGGGSTTTDGGGDSTSSASPTPSVSDATSTAVLTYGGCSCSSVFDYSTHNPPFKVCLQAAPNDKNWDGSAVRDTSSWTLYNLYNGAQRLSYNDTTNTVSILKCCNQVSYEYPEGTWNYFASQIMYPSGNDTSGDVHWPYNPPNQYQICNDSDHVFAFPGGTGNPSGVLTDTRPDCNHLTGVGCAVSTLSADEWYNFVIANPINPQVCP